MSPTPAGPSSPPPPLKPWGPIHFLVFASVCLLAGLAFWGVYERLGEQERRTTANSGETTRMRKDFETLKSRAEEELDELPKSDEELRRRLKGFEEKFTEAMQVIDTLRQQANRREAANAVSLEQITRLRYQGDRIRKNLKSLDEELPAWNASCAELMTNEEGKRIAAAGELLKQFLAVQDEARLSENEAMAWKEQADYVLTPVERAYKEKDASFIADERLVTIVNDLEQKTREAVRQLTQQRTRLSGILRQAANGSPASDGPTLEAAMKAQRQEWAAEEAETIAKELDRVREESAAKLAQVKADAQRQIGAEEAKAAELVGEIQARHIAEAAADLARNEDQRMDDRQKQLAREQLEREFQADLTEIKSLLMPFISDGYTQPGRQHRFAPTPQKGPVSFSALKGTGWLKKDIDALRAFHFAVTANRMNDRPAGSFPTQSVVQGHFSRSQPLLLRAQDLLLKYGDLMVEKGMLAP
jgi:hypothetical protein